MKVVMAGLAVEVDTENPIAAWWANAVAAGEWEPETFRALDALVKPGSCFLDIGSWIGPVSLYAASLGARVHAFEPDPKALAGLKRNLSLNPDLAERITVHPYGLWTESGTQRLSSSTIGDSGSTLRTRVAGEAVEVEVRRLECEVEQEYFRSASVIKVDIEGGEYPLLPDLARLVKRNDAALLLSTHVSFIPSMLPASWPRVLRAAVRRLLALRYYGQVIWHLRAAPYWYLPERGTWKPVGRLQFARLTMRPLWPQDGSVLVSHRRLPL